jgi:hypothetical protein
MVRKAYSSRSHPPFQFLLTLRVVQLLGSSIPTFGVNGSSRRQNRNPAATESIQGHTGKTRRACNHVEISRGPCFMATVSQTATES